MCLSTKDKIVTITAYQSVYLEAGGYRSVFGYTKTVYKEGRWYRSRGPVVRSIGSDMPGYERGFHAFLNPVDAQNFMGGAPVVEVQLRDVICTGQLDGRVVVVARKRKIVRRWGS